MISVGPDGIALAAACAGIGIGTVGIGGRSVKALSLIGAILGLCGAIWLLYRVVVGDVSRLEFPPSFLGELRNDSFSFAVVCCLVLHSMIVSLVCSADVGAPISRTSTNRFWIAAPIAATLAMLPLAPMKIALMYLAANVFASSISNNPNPRSRLFKSVGALVFVAAAYIQTADAGTPVFPGRMSPENLAFVLLAAVVVVPLASSAEIPGSDGPSLYSIASPFLLFAALIVQIGVSPLGDRLSAVVAFLSASFAASYSWRCLASQDSSQRNQMLFSTLQSLLVYQWASNGSLISALGVCAAFSCACLAFQLNGEVCSPNRDWWRRVALFWITASGLFLSTGRIIAGAIRHSAANPASITGAIHWISLVLAILSIATASSTIRLHCSEVGGLTDSVRAASRRFAGTVAAVVSALAGFFLMLPISIGTLEPNGSTTLKVFSRKTVSFADSIDRMSLALGFAAASIAIVVGACFAPRRTSTPSPTKGGPMIFARVIGFPFAVVERIVDSTLNAVFRIRDVARAGDNNVPSPALMIALVAAVCTAVLLSVQRGTSP